MTNLKSVVLYPYTPYSSSSWTTLLVLALFLLSSSSPIQTVDSESDSSREVQWQILTKLNFSSQIRLHPHILVMVTVPWSGESRSLMKELAYVIAKKQEKFVNLKLMLVYRSSDRMLADALGATEGITVLYYDHTLSYRYQGRLRAQNILSSVHHFMLLSPEEVPLKSLNTQEDLKTFLQSTDKALLLLEFCGWTPRLLAKSKNNGSENVFGFNGETNSTLAADGKKNQKRMESEKMNCGVDNGVSLFHSLGEFTPVNESYFNEAENMRSSDGVSCSFEEFQQFESLLPKFMSVVREFFLPPERLRFGWVPERSMLSSLGVGDSGSWLMMVYFAGCPNCSKVLKEGDDLKSVLQMQASLVTELEGVEHGLEATLPENKPSILLFIDRSSDSLKTRRKSKEALDAFRELALHNHISNQMSAQDTAKPQKSSVEAYQASTTSGHPRLELSPVSQKITALKEKMSIMIMNEGKPVTLDKISSDLQSSSLNEILAYVLQHKKGIKLSSLAKDVGFQLLSDDFDIKIEEALPTEVQSNKVSAEVPMEDLKGSVDIKKDQIRPMAGTFDGEHEELLEPTNAEPSPHKDKKTSFDTSKPLSLDPDHDHRDEVVANAADGMVEEKTLSVEMGEQQLHFTGFRGSFFFSDGQSRLLKALTGVSKIPSVVIIDPLSQKHYVLPEEALFSYSSLSDFLDRFLNGSLLPYQRSESFIMSPREAPSPPFVNLDFHAADSIPRVTAHTFSELVVGNLSDSTIVDNAWKKDVLVLFSVDWCGFCQRTELVVREVHRAFKGYAKMLKNGLRKKKSSLSNDDVKNAMLKLPLIYLMDCTLNDCSLILKSMTQIIYDGRRKQVVFLRFRPYNANGTTNGANKVHSYAEVAGSIGIEAGARVYFNRELYPSLLLFPAERKNSVSYGGDISVSNIIKFIADHGSNSHWVFRENVILWTGTERRPRNQNLYKDASQTAMHEEAPLAKDKYHEVLLKDRTQKAAVRNNQIIPRTAIGSHETAPQVVVGSIIIATDKLLNVHPFDESRVLIVKVNRSTGFQGLIINKHISWDSLQELEEGLELLKEAPLSFGGPVMIRGMPLVALTRKFIKDQYVEVLPDIYFLDQRATLNIIEAFKLGNQSVSDHWFFVGYSSWGWDQLFDEIAEGAWNISNGNVEQLNWTWR